MSKKFKWIVEFQVDEVWVMDGFDFTDQRALDMLSHDLSYANIGTELDARVLLSPRAMSVAAKQGYTNANQVKKERREGQLHDPSAYDLMNCLRQAYVKLDSVAFLKKEGDTDAIKDELEYFISEVTT